MPLQIVSPQSRVFPNTIFLHEFIHRQRTMDKFAAGGTPLSLPAIPQNSCRRHTVKSVTHRSNRLL